MPFVHNLNPVLLELGPVSIRWYGVFYALGFLATYFWARHAIKRGRLRMDEDTLDKLLVLLAIAMVVGARLFEVFVYHPAYYAANPGKVIAVWEGGLSFHGALLAVVLAAAWFVRRHGLRFLHVADAFIIPVVFANALGRFGNFINAELVGKATALPWGVQFPGYAGFRHPTPLYEVAYNLLIGITLLLLWRRQPKEGRIFAWFLVLYSILRFIVEFWKDLPLYGPLTMGQWLNIPLLIAGVWLLRR